MTVCEGDIVCLMRRTSPVCSVACGIVLCVAMIVVSALACHGPLEVETIAFLRSYWSDHSLLQRVFNPNGNDFGSYQARELSYAVHSRTPNGWRACGPAGSPWYRSAASFLRF